MMTLLISMACGTVAFIYATVGHAGASGYIAVLMLCGIASGEIRSTALILNIVVALAASIQFIRAKQISVRILWPFLVTSIPAAFLGGMIAIPSHLYKRISGVLLVISALRILLDVLRARTDTTIIKPLKIWASLSIGAVLGFISGLIGIGGGIFLSPILIFLAAAPLRSISGIAAVFILANSLSGFLGLVTHGIVFSEQIFFTLPAALLGGMLGAYIGSRRLPGKAIRSLLVTVLIIGAGKLILLG